MVLKVTILTVKEEISNPLIRYEKKEATEVHSVHSEILLLIPCFADTMQLNSGLMYIANGKREGDDDNSLYLGV